MLLLVFYFVGTEVFPLSDYMGPSLFFVGLVPGSGFLPGSVAVVAVADVAVDILVV